MFFINYFKGEPTDYIFKFSGGKILKEGVGISFFSFELNTTIIAVPVKTIDSAFIFNEITHNYQAVTVQGQLTYKIKSPHEISSRLDFSIDPRTGRYNSDDPGKLSQRIINAAQIATRSEIQRYSLEDAVKKTDVLSKEILDKIKKDPFLETMSIECLNISLTAVTPTPEISKALEAEYRETLQKKADEAIYSRRAAAVEQEKKIKENELSSEIAIEKGRQQLVELNGANTLKEAEFKSKATELELAPYKNLDPRILLAQGFRTLGENASKIGNLTITPDLLSAILNEKK
ncbi:MAG TPA: SPFH domain-containing protein [Candidatus Wallbacteria bacterium]|nr:SPFH domain-containing protein [Candidatus Wallbacteria bacterium]